jgi:hypothetical protein
MPSVKLTPDQLEQVNQLKSAAALTYQQKGSRQFYKPQYCALCFTTQDGKHYRNHQPDLTDPLVVIPLCSTCHGKIKRGHRVERDWAAYFIYFSNRADKLLAYREFISVKNQLKQILSASNSELNSELIKTKLMVEHQLVKKEINLWKAVLTKFTMEPYEPLSPFYDVTD